MKLIQNYLAKKKLTLQNLTQFDAVLYYNNNIYTLGNDSWIDVSKEFFKKKLDVYKKFNVPEAIFIPIYNLYNEPVRIQVRILGHNIITHDSSTGIKQDLFNLNNAYKEILKENNVYVVEGVFDAIGLYSFGIKNCVGLLGTALKKEQFYKLSRFTDKITLVLDNDVAGKDACTKIKQLYKKYLQIDIINCPSDPDEYIGKFGKESFLRLQHIKNKEIDIKWLLKKHH